MNARKYDRRIRIEKPTADESFDGAGSGTWAPVGEAWANVQDMLPSRGEKLANGINVASRPARVRMRYRSDITSGMQVVILRQEAGEWVPDRVAQIVTVPAELGRRDGIEFVIESHSVAGNAA